MKSWHTIRSFVCAIAVFLFAAAEGTATGAYADLRSEAGLSIADGSAPLNSGKTSSVGHADAHADCILGGAGSGDSDVARRLSDRPNYDTVAIVSTPAFAVHTPVARVRNGLSRAPPAI